MVGLKMDFLPMQDFKFDGKAPVILFGYGGYNEKLLPTFSINKLIFVDGFDGAYAVANIRGGG